MCYFVIDFQEIKLKLNINYSITILFMIPVSNVDNTRMDLSIPGEKNLYLRAPSSQERQLWLVALGSSKACLTNGKRKESGIFFIYINLFYH